MVDALTFGFRGVPEAGQAGKSTGTLIKFAWLVEITGVLCGILNSFYITYGANPPPFGVDWLAVAPLAVLGATEILRIPLAEAFCQRRGFLVRAGAFVMILIAGGIAVENWAFGIERIVNIRISAVTTAQAAVDESKTHQANLTSTGASAAAQSDGERNRLHDTVSRNETRLTQWGKQIADAGATHARNLAEITDACKRIRAVCIEPRSRQEDERYETEMRRLEAAQATDQAALTAAQTQLTSIDQAGHEQAIATQQEIADAKHAVEEKEVALRAATRDSPIHRFAAMYYGVQAAALKDDQIGNARLFFSLFGAICISFAGTGAAMVHFAKGKVPGRGPVENLLRAMRGYLGRRRKRVVRIQVKEVPKEVEKVVIKEVPEKIIEIHKVVEKVKLVPYSGGLPIEEAEGMPETVVGDGEPPETVIDGSNTREETHEAVIDDSAAPKPDVDAGNVTPLSDRRRS